MNFNIKEINRILNNIGDRTSSDYDICGKTWGIWQTKMLEDNLSYRQLPLEESIDKLFLFQKCGDYSEENFKKWFPTITYKQYVDPNTLFNTKRVSKGKLQSIAFELQEHLQLEFNQLISALEEVYLFEKEFTFDTLTERVLRFDTDLHFKMLKFKIINENKVIVQNRYSAC